MTKLIVSFLFIALLLLIIKNVIYIIENSKLKKYEEDIKSNNIEFTQNIYNEYSISGIDIRLDFNVCSYTEKDKSFLTKDLVKMFNEIIYKELPDDIVIALKKEGIKLYLRDSESIQLERVYLCSGFYNSKAKEIHLGLQDYKLLRKTFFHEIGHFIDYIISSANYENNVLYLNENDVFYSDYNFETKEIFKVEANKFREYAGTSKREFIAIIFEEYLNNKESLKDMPLVEKLVKHYLKKINLKYIDTSFMGDSDTANEKVFS